MSDSSLKAFERPDELREFPFGRFEIIHIAGATLGRATYQPGWKWSVHNAPIAGTKLCHAPHTGMVLSGHGVVEYEDGKCIDLLPERFSTSLQPRMIAGLLEMRLMSLCIS
jgi:hypothetical protein